MKPRASVRGCTPMILKRGALGSDKSEMLFSPRSVPDLDAAQLRSVRCALNSPVVAIAQLPVGPASAAIAIHTDPSGGSDVTVAVRCRRTGDVALFGAHDETGEDSISNDAALSLAEGMGFVFDDEVCELGEGGEADGIWRRFVASAMPPAADCAASAENARQTRLPIGLSKFRWSQQRDGAPAPESRAGD